VATVESVKAVGEVFAPLSGEVVEVNRTVESSPDLVNKDPYGEGWLFVIKMGKEGELDLLMDAAAYEKFLEGKK
jgi:glycine cleavage system H protein